MPPSFFDAHTHVHFAAFKDDCRETVERARAAGVSMIAVGTQRDTSRHAVEIANLYPDGVYASIGLHPIHTSRSYHDAQELGAGEDAKGFTSRGEEFDYGYYLELGRDPKVVAVGECGLDYYRLDKTADIEDLKLRQKAAFEDQIKLAKELKKPLMIHCREAFPDLIALLAVHYKLLTAPPGVIHFFTGNMSDAEKLLEMGFGFTFGGVVTFTRDYDEVIRMIPADRILSETDAPYVAPAPYRGKRNEPRYVVEVVKKLAELKGLSEAEMAEQIMENARRIFRLPS